MDDFYHFAGSHPWLTLALAYLALEGFCAPFKIINRWIRSRNIKNAG